MPITVVFAPPLPSDSPEVFNSKAFSTLGDLNNWSTQANAVADQINKAQPNVDIVAGNIANINAAVADLPALSAKVSKTGDTMTGPLSVPAGATGAQVPQAQEVYLSTAVEISTASGSSVDITGIPTNWNEIHLHFKGTAHTGPLEILAGDSTGYAGWVYDTVNSAVTSAGSLGIGQKTNAIGVRSGAAGATISGVIVFNRISLAEWCFNGTLSGLGADTRTIWVGGRMRDSDNTDPLNSFRLVPAGAFTGGSVLIRGRK